MFNVLGWVFFVLGFFIPFIFNIAGIIMGVFSIKRGSKTQGTVLIVLHSLWLLLGILGSILGLAIIGSGVLDQVPME
ncbi:MAG TPA: hypothetical protein VFV52_09590 [Bacilli bacterium]|nr:hypothetical protein [Bacilli bacterium]